MILSKEEREELKLVKITKKKVIIALFIPTSLVLLVLIGLIYRAVVGRGLPTFKEVWMVVSSYVILTFCMAFVMFLFELVRIRIKTTVKDRETRRFALIYYAIIIILVILASKLKK